MIRRNEHCTFVITGATDGIGLALARRLQARRDRLVLVGRRPPEVLRDAGFEDALYCQVDLAQPHCAEVVEAFLEQQDAGAIHGLIHNAGAGYFGGIQDQSPESITELVHTNLAAPIGLTWTLLPRLERVCGQVCFVSSVAAALPMARYAVYVATKAALEGFARNLRIESRGRVRVQVVRPGATRTGMHAKAGMSLADADWERFTPAERVAAQMERALDAPRKAVTLGAGNKVISKAGRLFPGIIEAGMRRRNEAPPAIDTEHEGRPRCFITGAADGIGRAMALRFARSGYDIVAIDNDPVKSAETTEEIQQAGAKAEFSIQDLSDPAATGRAVEAVRTGGPVDLVVHNAGINAVGRFGAIPLGDQEAVIGVNLQAPLLLTAGLLHAGLVRQDARFVFMASLSCYVGYPGAAAYAASKDGLAAYARALSVALGPRRRVLTVFPGPVRTAHAARHSPDNSRADRRMPPETLAAFVDEALARNQRILIPGAGNRAVALLARLWPAPFEAIMRRAILDKLEPGDVAAMARQ
ncbi:MAG: SDR family NAD(P)-dependent oxidoreductase [Candidatus Hydrogenedentota bacterium]